MTKIRHFVVIATLSAAIGAMGATLLQGKLQAPEAQAATYVEPKNAHVARLVNIARKSAVNHNARFFAKGLKEGENASPELYVDQMSDAIRRGLDEVEIVLDTQGADLSDPNVVQQWAQHSEGYVLGYAQHIPSFTVAFKGCPKEKGCIMLLGDFKKAIEAAYISRS